MSGKQYINFFEQVRSDSGALIRPDKRVRIALPFCAAILFVFILWLVFTGLDFHAGRRLSAIGEALSGIKNSAEDSDAYHGPEIDDMLRMELEYNDSNRLTSARLKEVFALQPDDLSVRGVTYYGGRIAVDGWSKRVLCGADFAKLLREIGAFSGVEYNGVTASENGYSFTVSFDCANETGDAR